MLWTALLVGWVGSLHCVGMCGPIVMSLPLKGRRGASFWSGHGLYHLGKIFTYSLMGAVSGLLGKAIFLAGWQQGLSIALGIALLAVALFSFHLNPRFSLNRLLHQVKMHLSKQLHIKSDSSLFIIGMLNGLLPCGLVYWALAGAAAMSDVGLGMAYMTLFGLGTAPALLGIASLQGILGPKVRTRLQPLIRGWMILFALLLIVRGLNLGIPYLSPQLAQESEIVECH